MKVLVAGAHGHTGRLLLGRLADAGHAPFAMVRDPAQADAVVEAGAVVVVHADLEDWDLAGAVREVDAVIFAAGSGSKTGVDRTISVDLMGAVRLIDACEEHGPDRFVMLSSMSTRDPHGGNESMRHYYTAKAEADAYLERTELVWTIARPGRLSFDEGTGLVTVGTELERGDPLPRPDLAAILAACLDQPATEGKVFEIVGGGTPIDQALTSV
ncbi:MAG: SDR family oxidoreductase [Actinobacteria bacterium]|nr:SDR family oxidoreductase [Actinomycetota bacterium]